MSHKSAAVIDAKVIISAALMVLFCACSKSDDSMNQDPKSISDGTGICITIDTTWEEDTIYFK